jgi:transcriptional regulator with XRE-family HTH domain
MFGGYLSEESFGERLSMARQKRGLSEEQVSEFLRIRPNIIQALEDGDFSNMPLKGYARNMVSSYARFLDLDPVQITEQFLREYRSYEDQKRRGLGSAAATAQTGVIPGLGGRVVEQSRRMVSGNRHNRSGASLWGGSDQSRLGRGYDSRSPDAQRTATSAARRRSYDGSNSRNRSYRDTTRPPLSMRLLGPLVSRPVLLIVLLVVLLAAVLIVWAVIANSCSNNAANDVLPVTGVSSSQQTDGTDTSDIPPVEQEPVIDPRYGSFDLVVEVSGGASWLEITVDGTQVVYEVMEDGWSGAYVVKDSALVRAAAPDYVTVRRNGEDVALEMVDGQGQAELKVEQPPADDAGTGGEGSGDTTGNNAAGTDATGTTGTEGDTGTGDGSQAPNAQQ